MAGFEDLIRGALAKQANPSSETRERVYESARQALDRMLEGNDSLSPEVVTAQRVKLEEAIKKIDATYGDPPVTPAAVSPPLPPSPSPSPSQNAANAAPAPKAEPVRLTPEPTMAQPIPAPKVAPETPSAPAAPVAPAAPIAAPAAPAAPVAAPPASVTAAPTVSAPAAPPATPVVEPHVTTTTPAPSVAASPSVATIPEPPKPVEEETDYPDAYLGDALRERRPYAKMLLWAIILVGLGVAGWWVYSNGRALVEQELGGGVPNPPRTLESGASSGAQDEEGWITVFAPQDDAQSVGTPGAGAAELQQDGNRAVMRLASPDAALSNNLLIRMPRGSMEALKGKSATFELIVRSAGDEDQSFVIFCEFGSMGDCGRKRFVAGSNPKPILFDVLINDASLGTEEDAFISLNTDFEGTGRALDLYSIRVRESG